MVGVKQQELAQHVEQMYNAHPFPSRYSMPDLMLDERQRHIYKEFLRIPIGDLENKIFLDAGCGTGENTWAWRRMLPESTTVIGMDLSKGSLSLAKDAFEETERPLFANNSLLNLGLADESVDFLLCSGVLVAVANPDQAFKELVRVLKPGGYIVIILYHKYGRAIHGLRRAVVDFLEPNDPDRRVELGGKLFGTSMKKMAEEAHCPVETVLYDQFGLICESRYSFHDALTWYNKHNVDYLGSWPPISWSQFGSGLRFKEFEILKHPLWGKILLNMFPDGKMSPSEPPNLPGQLSMELLWAFRQLQLFSISGRKKA